jgi:hypothetical protein
MLALMEHRDYFTFRNASTLIWLGAVVVTSLAAVFAFPPAFWLCGVGGVFVAIGALSNSVRTGQWYSWQNWEPSLSWFEGWAVTTGAILAVLPLLVIIMRSWVA